MPTVNIDGKDIEFEGSPKLLQFALDNGIEIPYFCYHPSMSIPTNCRMCLVEVGYHARDRATGEYQFDEEGKPIIQWGRKPNTACNTPVGDKMFVKTHRTSPEIKVAQAGVLEYMLVNHPLDCPICDQAGECPLQIWTYKYGPEGSRFEVAKGHKKKRVDLGPRVVLDEERCINCTRCTRFTSEISGTNQLTIVGRGDKNCPATPPGETFDDPYSMNTIDICPVGALTSKAHRFKARTWEMAYVPAIDMNDSTGTNIYVWIRDNEVLRITPRENQDINAYWMPDAYRLNVAYYNENRSSGMKIKGGIPINFDEGIERAAKVLQNAEKKIFFLGSASASMESNFALKKLAAAHGVKKIHYVTHVEEGSGDNWLMQDDKTVNAAACELLGFTAISLDEFKKSIKSAEVDTLYALEDDLTFSQLGSELNGINAVVHSLHEHPSLEMATVVLPAATSIEGEGTYINSKNIPQVSTLAKQIRQMTPEQWMQLPKSRLDKGAVAVDRWRNLDNIFDVLPSWLLIAKVSGHTEKALDYATHADVFKEMQGKFSELKDLKVSYKAPKHAFKMSQLERAPKW